MICSIINAIKAKFSKKSSEESHFIYNSLTPTKNASIGEYGNALCQALTNDQINNIAITGPYGSGKSSVIKSFENKYKNKYDFEFLNISLATFDLDSDSDSDSDLETKNTKLTPEQKTKKNIAIEKSLLQQIIFKVPANELDDSNIYRLQAKKYLRAFGLSFLFSNLKIALLFVSWAFVFTFLAKPEHSFFKDNIFILESYSWFYQLFAFLSSVALLQYLINTFPKLRLNKLGFASAEISFNEKNGDSVLNKHLDEIIYFFSKTKYNIVVFEDLDRFPTKDIFVNLRELNRILNNSSEIINQNKQIKFIFALGDEVFKENLDRTKFFDFIVPIIPFVTSSNSAKHLQDEIEKAFKEHDIPDDFFSGVALFIDDMRLLLNIANEFVIYKKRLMQVSDIELKDHKLLGMIVYKNKYHSDFKELNYKRGYLFSIFAQQPNIVKNVTSELEQDIADFKSDKEKIDSELLTSKDDLKKIYLFEIMAQLEIYSDYLIDGTTYSADSILDESTFNELIKKVSVRYKNTQNNALRNAVIDFDEIEGKLDSEHTYAERVDLIESRTSQKIIDVNSSITLKTRELQGVKNLKIHELINSFPNENYFPEHTKYNSDLIEFLIVGRYIEEDYDSYISFFYEGQLSVNDKQFLINVTTGKTSKYDYKLNNPLKILKEFKNLERLRDKSLLNLDLFEHMLNEHLNSSFLTNSMFAIVDNKTEGYRFVYDLLTTRNSGHALISQLNKIDSSYWEALLTSHELNQDETNEFLLKFLEHIDIKLLEKGKSKEFLTKYLSESPDAFKILRGLGLENSDSIISTLNIKFSNLEICADIDLLEIINKNNAYKTTSLNIKVLLRKHFGVENKNIAPNYTSIINSSKEELKNHINKNINEYVKNVLINIKGNNEDEESIIKLLNHLDILDELSIQVIENCNFSIKDIDSIGNQELWKHLFKNSKILADWPNIIAYFKLSEETLTEELISFLDINAAQLAATRINTKTEHAINLCKQLIYSDTLLDETYGSILKSIPRWYSDLSDIIVSEEKVEYLVNLNKLQLTSENFNFLVTELPLFTYKLVEMNPAKYLDNVSEFNLDNYDYAKLIESVKLTRTSKINIIKTITLSNYSSDEEFTKNICTYVISKTTQKVFDIELVESLLGLKIGLDLKVAIFNRYSSDLNSAKIKSLILQIEKMKDMLNKGRPKIPRSLETIKLAEFLKEKGFLTFKEEGKEIRLFPNKTLYE